MWLLLVQDYGRESQGSLVPVPGEYALGLLFSCVVMLLPCVRVSGSWLPRTWWSVEKEGPL